MNGASVGSLIAEISCGIAALGAVNAIMGDIDQCIEPATVLRSHRACLQTLETLRSRS